METAGPSGLLRKRCAPFPTMERDCARTPRPSPPHCGANRSACGAPGLASATSQKERAGPLARRTTGRSSVGQRAGPRLKPKSALSLAHTPRHRIARWANLNTGDMANSLLCFGLNGPHGAMELPACHLRSQPSVPIARSSAFVPSTRSLRPPRHRRSPFDAARASS